MNLQSQNYLLTVEQFFLTLKNHGLALSATDYDLIQQWECRGIPINVVCRGIKNGIIEFLLFARREPGDKNLKLCPSFSATQSNINKLKSYGYKMVLSICCTIFTHHVLHHFSLISAILLTED